MRARRGFPWRWLAIAAICLWSLFPIYWTLNTSLTTNDAAQAIPAHYVPRPFTLANYAQLFGLQGQANSATNLWPQISRSLINITVECAAATLLTLIIAVFSAYAFARMEFRLKNVILGTVIATLALPAYATLIPLYRMMSDAGLVNTYTGIVLVYASGFLPLAMWILYSYYSGLPRALEEAAAIDGASLLGTLFSIVIPLALPGIAATAIITFLSAWGQFLFPLVLSSDITTQPLTVFITGLQTQHTVPYTLLNAAGVLCIIVPAAMVMFLNRYIISGILAGGVK
jgi:multiple sugar transport system permease protein